MQHTTTTSRARHFGGQIALAAAMIVMAALGALAASGTLGRPVAPAQTPAAPAVARPQIRAFADEAAYVPAPAEYAALPADEGYLPIAAAPAVAQPARPLGRTFADEAAYVPSAAEYAALPSGVSLDSSQAGPR